MITQAEHCICRYGKLADKRRVDLCFPLKIGGKMTCQVGCARARGPCQGGWGLIDNSRNFMPNLLLSLVQMKGYRGAPWLHDIPLICSTMKRGENLKFGQKLAGTKSSEIFGIWIS